MSCHSRSSWRCPLAQATTCGRWALLPAKHAFICTAPQKSSPALLCHQNLLQLVGTSCSLVHILKARPCAGNAAQMLTPSPPPCMRALQVGCLVWWLATGNHLFSDTLELGPPSTQGGAGAGQGAAPPPPLTLEEKHLADMITSFGRIPSEVGGPWQGFACAGPVCLDRQPALWIMMPACTSSTRLPSLIYISRS